MELPGWVSAWRGTAAKAVSFCCQALQAQTPHLHPLEGGRDEQGGIEQAMLMHPWQMPVAGFGRSSVGLGFSLPAAHPFRPQQPDGGDLQGGEHYGLQAPLPEGLCGWGGGHLCCLHTAGPVRAHVLRCGEGEWPRAQDGVGAMGLEQWVLAGH